MIQFSTELTIRRPLSEVFSYWSDPDNIPHWQSGVVSYRREGSGPVGVGCKYVVTRKALGMQQETRGELTAYEANRRIVEQVQAGPARYTVETRFIDQGGQTRIAVETRIELGGLIGRLGEKMAGGPIRKQAENDHQRIKELLEGR